MSQPVEQVEPAAEGKGDRVAARAGLGFALFSNTDLAIVITMLPVAVLHGGRLDPLVVSLALSIQVASALVGSVLTPIVLARLRPALTLAVSSALKAAGIAVLVAGSTPPHLYLFGVLGGVGLGVSRPAVRLLLNGAVPPSGRTRVFQVFFIMVNLAHVAAPLVAELSRDHAVPALVLLLAVELVVGVTIAVSGRSVAAEPRAPRGSRSGVFLDRQVLVLVAYTFICYLAMGFVMTMFQLYESVVPELGEYRPYLLGYEPLVLIAMQLALIPLIGKLGVRTLYLAAAVTGGLGVVLAFTSSLVAVVVGLTLFALSECLALPKIQVVAGEIAPPGRTGAVFSLVTVCTAVGEISGTLVAGVASRTADPALYGQVVGVVVLVGMLLGGLALLRGHRRAAAVG